MKLNVHIAESGPACAVASADGTGRFGLLCQYRRAFYCNHASAIREVKLIWRNEPK